MRGKTIYIVVAIHETKIFLDMLDIKNNKLFFKFYQIFSLNKLQNQFFFTIKFGSIIFFTEKRPPLESQFLWGRGLVSLLQYCTYSFQNENI